MKSFSLSGCLIKLTDNIFGFVLIYIRLLCGSTQKCKYIKIMI